MGCVANSSGTDVLLQLEALRSAAQLSQLLQLTERRKVRSEKERKRSRACCLFVKTDSIIIILIIIIINNNNNFLMDLLFVTVFLKFPVFKVCFSCVGLRARASALWCFFASTLGSERPLVVANQNFSVSAPRCPAAGSGAFFKNSFPWWW